MSSEFVYMVVYLLVHGLYSVFEVVRDGFAYLYDTIVQVVGPSGVRQQQDRSRLYRMLCDSTKMPRHVTVLLGGEEPNYSSLANVIVWCLALGIPFVSFYDHRGVLKKHQSELEREVEKRRGKECTVIWHDDPPLSYKNGVRGPKVHAKVLTGADGKSGVAAVCRDLAGQPGPLDWGIEGLDERLRLHYEFPDPELALLCGPAFCLFDYPPWQARVTEFFRVRSHQVLTFQQFGDVLLRYGRCEQRLGR